MDRRKFLTYLGLGGAAAALTACGATAPACAKPVLDPSGNAVVKLVGDFEIPSPYGQIVSMTERLDGYTDVQIAFSRYGSFTVAMPAHRCAAFYPGDTVLWQCEMNGAITVKSGRGRWA